MLYQLPGAPQAEAQATSALKTRSGFLAALTNSGSFSGNIASPDTSTTYTFHILGGGQVSVTEVESQMVLGWCVLAPQELGHRALFLTHHKCAFRL